MSLLHDVGAAANTLSGTITVQSGILALDKPSGTIAVAGNLQIGVGNGNIPQAEVLLEQSGQIASNLAIVLDNGMYAANGISQTLGTLSLPGTKISILNLSGNTGFTGEQGV